MSDNGTNVGILVSVGSAIGSLIAILTFWTRYSDRITIAEKDAKNALQEAAEVKNDFDNLREAHDSMIREMHDQIERLRHENGESLTAIRQHITEVAFFIRDNFVRSTDFSTAINKIDGKLDDISSQMRDDRRTG